MLRLFSLTTLLTALVALAAPATAETLQEAVTRVLEAHERVQAAAADVASSRERIEETFGTNWYPQLDVTVDYGHERQMNKPSDTDYDFTQLDMTVTQRLWDFGGVKADMEVARATHRQYQQTLESVRQSLILEAVTAFHNVRRSRLMLGYARRSEGNILKQTEVENVRVSLGQGYSTDVLQAKAQLAGAQARRVQAEGGLVQSNNRVRAVYQRAPEEVAGLTAPRLPLDRLPEQLEQAVDTALAENPQLRTLGEVVALMRATKDSTQAATFFPSLNGIFQNIYKDDVSATADFQEETVAKVELTYPLNLGMSGRHTLTAAERDLDAAQKRLEDTRLSIEEQVRNAWQNLRTSRQNATLLRSQANIAGKFLELAREERKLGKRSLLDVLNGETALINAQSDAASAEADIAIAAYTLIQAMGRLALETLVEAGGEPAATPVAESAAEVAP